MEQNTTSIYDIFSENLFVDSDHVSPQILQASTYSHAIIALVTQNSSPIFTRFGFCDGIFHFIV